MADNLDVSKCADCVEILVPSTCQSPKGLSRAVQLLLYLYIFVAIIIIREDKLARSTVEDTSISSHGEV
jgi:hypothetical protein